ncbi:MAG: Indolepyruvate ferredoxin oxidoreductase [Solirubrobacterales bacterium]|nr:Indolepyruvate ferredoxin oxidoreductase [Solirubrobacterales bacterium]
MAATKDQTTTAKELVTGTTGGLAAAGAPVKLARPETTLRDKYVLEQGTIFLSGVQALVRVLLDQQRADRRAGLRTATFVSGYQGSPLGGFDKEVMGLKELAGEYAIEFTPGLNEELAATAVYGSQLVQNLPEAKQDGVVGVWYGKNPGLDRAMDALRHANFAGTHPNGGALALVGDDPSCKSSTLPSGGEATLAALNVPTFYPGNLQEVLDLGLHAIACSRASGLWSALKIVTNVADAAGTAEVWPSRVVPVLPTVEYEGAPYRHRPNGHLLAPDSLELERTLFGPRLELARQYGALNQLNPISLPTRDAWLGIVAAGKTYYELLQALRELGLEQRDLERAGVRLMKVGMLYPHDREGFRQFARGLDEILVVEEKLPFLETAVRDALYGAPDQPRILGKRDEDGRSLVPAESELDADTISLAVAGRIERHARIDSVHARAHAIAERRVATERTAGGLARTPFFCSGCPHNTSTANPDDTLLGVGIGCHTMVLLNPEGKGTITGLTQMGGEGTQFIGMQPFTDTKQHFVQNLGDGTFHHSGSLAIRFAAASKVNVTYKLLYNSTVAMTGGQDVLGQLTVPELTTWLRLEGVKQVIVTTEEPGRYKGVKLDPIAKLMHRDRLAEAMAELREVEGVTVLIHDQDCAAERRRLRKRGKAETPPQRIHINERVCEGCGDCGEKSACLSVLPVETEFGRKTQIHQASCNLDFSCVKGDCPSFLEIVPAKKQAAKKAFPAPPAELPDPVLRVPRDDFLVRMPGVGGTGVVTVSQILQMAAMLDGKHAFGLDQTGLAQKGGPVISDIRISRERIEGSNKASAASADLLLGFDILGAASPKNLLVADPERTVAVISTTVTPTAKMVLDPSVSFPAQRRNLRAIEKVTRARDNVYVDAQALSESLFGDHMPTNLLLIGAAFQAGTLPLSADAIEHAIKLNGAAVEKSLAAFRWGRASVAFPDLVGDVVDPSGAVEDVSVAARRIVEATGAEGELRRLLDIRVEDLLGYQGAKYAQRYADDVMAIASIDGPIGEVYARGLHKLMAYKDEYEVARLHLDTIEQAKIEGTFGRGAKVRFLLHPPVLRALGMQRKLKLGRWFVPFFRLLRASRRLRGTALDPFGKAEVRRVERGLIGEYRELVTGSVQRLHHANHDKVAEIAGLADMVRGYEDIKLRNVERFRERAAELTAAL